MSLTPEQREERRAGLGGSDALAYCGKDPRCTPLELYLQKIGEVEPEQEPGPRLEWGSRLEPVLRDWFQEKLGRRIRTSSRMYRSTELPFMVGHLDGITDSPTEGIELKTADKFAAQEFGDVDTDQVPVRYVLQCMHYMVVSGLKRFRLAVLIGGNEPKDYVIDWDQWIADELIKRARTFWHYVETKTPPPPVNLADTDRRWPQSHGQTVMANEAIAHAVAELKKKREEAAAATAQADAVEVTLKAFMGDAGALIDARRHLLATWRSQTRERFDQRRFIEAHPDLAAQYRATSEFRVFRLR